MLDDFLFRALLAGLGLALAAGPLGCFVVWRRMAYFGDATAHAALMGVAFSLAFSLSTFIGVLFASAMMALAIGMLSGRRYAMDTLLGVMAHVALAAGLVAVSKISGVRLDLNSYLFGDILAVTRTDIVLIWLGALFVFVLMLWRWTPFLLTTLSTELAVARGYDAQREQMMLMLMLAVLVAVAIKLVGALLITAMLIVPPAAARPFARTPEWMAVGAVLIGMISVAGGLGLSMYADTPSGPSVVVMAGVLFLLSNVLAGIVQRRRIH